MANETTRATFTIDKDLWTSTQKLLSDMGYPDTTMAVYLAHQVEKLNLQLTHTECYFLQDLI